MSLFFVGGRTRKSCGPWGAGGNNSGPLALRVVHSGAKLESTSLSTGGPHVPACFPCSPRTTRFPLVGGDPGGGMAEAAIRGYLHFFTGGGGPEGEWGGPRFTLAWFLRGDRAVTLHRHVLFGRR